MSDDRGSRPLSRNQAAALAVVKDARAGEISGLSIATWLLKRRNPTGMREVLRSLVNRGLVVMRPMDDPTDEWRQRFPDRMKAMYSIAVATTPKETEQTPPDPAHPEPAATDQPATGETRRTSD
jgi:hypothetical protein